MESIKKGRVLRDTLYGRVRMGTAVLKSHAASTAAAGYGAGASSAAAPAAAPGSAAGSSASAAPSAATLASLPPSCLSPPPPSPFAPAAAAAAPPAEMTVVIKEYERDLVERRVTRSGHPVYEDAKNELRLHAALCRTPPAPSPHIVRLYDLRSDTTCYYAVLEYCALGEFFALVAQENFTREHARHFFVQLMRGLAFMHGRGIAHRDLSLENMLLQSDYTLKICDFGVAIECGPPGSPTGLVAENTGPVGKLAYMAPEVLARHAHDARASDLWSAGVILFVMLVRVFPFDRPTLSDDRFVHACSGRINHMLSAWGKPLLDDAAIDLFGRLFAPAERRGTAESVLQHPFCTGGGIVRQPQLQPQDQQQQQAQQASAAPAPAAASAAAAAAASLASAAAAAPGSGAMDTADQPGS